MTLSQKALDIAISQLGIEESPKGSNSGPQVNLYLASVGLGPGYSWCMALVYWCHQQAAEAMGLKNPMHKTGGVLMQWQKRKVYYRAITPLPGDVFIMDYGRGMGHTGLVEKVHEDTVDTIEGNTNDEGSREGYEVCRRIRPRSKIIGYLRFS